MSAKNLDSHNRWRNITVAQVSPEEDAQIETAVRLTGLTKQDYIIRTDDDGQGGLTFEIEKGRLSFRLTAPYSEERRKKASAWAKERGIQAQT